MGEWTTAQVQDRLELAAGVMRQMPGVMPQGFFNAWPEYLHSFADKVGQEPQMRRSRPSPRQITQAEEAMLWLRWLESEDARLVWARVDGMAWKPICWQFGISRATANRRWQYGLAVIVWRLNGKRVPTKRSKAFVVSKAASRLDDGGQG
ncbi:MAG TPA: hypothetical protein ENN42_09135 [Thioalkalivibrio sp.]|nr:hypothetical protein [Thioalkalivibrio sp.]